MGRVGPGPGPKLGLPVTSSPIDDHIYAVNYFPFVQAPRLPIITVATWFAHKSFGFDICRSTFYSHADFIVPPCPRDRKAQSGRVQEVCEDRCVGSLSSATSSANGN